MEISRLEKVLLRDLWPHEALDFTKWLAENLDLLGELLDIKLSLVESEATAGVFSADIKAEDAQGDYVVIENQLGKTDHDHLGKLLTYLSNLEAKTAIWISSDPRPEHEKAIHWLNETLPVDVAFYLLKIEAYKIDNSDPAPLISIIARPTAEGKQAGNQRGELAERHLLRLRFWEQLLDRANKKTSLHANRTPSKENWIGAGSGKSEIHYTYLIRMDDAEIRLSIESSDAGWNKRIFDKLHENKEGIEEKFGEPLEWDRLDELKTSYIKYRIPSSGLSDRDRWSELQDKMIDAMIRLESAFKPEIENL